MMSKRLTTLILFLALTTSGVAQEDDAAGAAGEAPDTVETETETDDSDATLPEPDPEEDEEVDDSDLDEQTYESDDDEFVPTEEIPADEPIPFPSNI